MAENKVVDFIEKGIHHRTSYAWKCCYNAHLSIKRIRSKKLNLVVSFSFPFALFFVIMPKNWVGRKTLNKEKKGDALLI